MQFERGPDEPDKSAFSHDILDQEAAAYRRLVSSIQQDIAGGELTPSALFALAEQCDREGRNLEAEFIYLHFINVWETKCRPSYPINFRGLRDYARQLLQLTLEVLANDQPQAEEFRAAA